MLGRVARQSVIVWAAARVRGVIETIASDAAHLLYSSALALKDFLGGSDQYLDLGLPDVQQLLQTWLSLNEITQAEYDGLLALADGAGAPSLDVPDGATVMVKGLIPGLPIGTILKRSNDKFYGPGSFVFFVTYILANPELFEVPK